MSLIEYDKIYIGGEWVAPSPPSSISLGSPTSEEIA
jgi:hypothetical protein